MERLERSLERQMSVAREREQVVELLRAEARKWAELRCREELQKQEMEARLTKMEDNKNQLKKHLKETEQECYDTTADLSAVSLQLQVSLG